MVRDFIKVEDSTGVVQIINIRQIVRVAQAQQLERLEVVLAHGDPVILTKAQAEKLFKGLGIQKNELGPTPTQGRRKRFLAQ